ncbi:MAG TPA: hypothetical protein VEY12_11335, partial [Thermoplasmata archaeon]|nr:hypothetical protein [Thermoplasmata archaeon]
FIPEAIDIVKGGFEEEWLRQRAHAKTRATALPFSDHPLGDCFAVAGPNQIVEILELAVYIKRLVRAPRLETVLHAMREQYGPGLLQLAYAYRFQRLGASAVELEPAAAGGRQADISFDLSRVPYLVECYIPEVRDRNTSHELHYSTGAIFDALSERGARIRRVCIRLTRPINAADRKRIERVTIAAIRTMGDASRVDAQDEAALISVEGVSDMAVDTDFPRPGERRSGRWLYGDADWSMDEQLVPDAKIPDVRRGKAPFPSGNRIFVWRAPGEERSQSFEQRVEELVDKISGKLAQTRRHDGPGRIIVASIPEALDRDAETMRLMTEIQNQLLRKHRGVAALLLTTRVWTTQKRHQYQGFVLFGEEGQRLPKEVFDRLQELEGEADILEDWR